MCLLAVLVFFQNCSDSQKPSGSSSPAQKSGGTTGYDGKIFLSYGECGQDLLGVKSQIQVTATEVRVIRSNCTDLSEIERQPLSSIIPSQTDATVLAFGNSAFDQHVMVNENKLTTAFCYGEHQGQKLEAMIWYRSETLASNPDPRLAKELFGQVTYVEGWKSEILNVHTPEVFTDRLVYRSPSAFELVQTRDGLNSQLRFRKNGTDQHVSVACH